MAKTFAVKIDVSKVNDLVDRVSQLSPDQLGGVIVDTLNEVVEETYVLSRKHIQKNINVKDSYIDRTMGVEKATPGKPTATITAAAVDTNVSHYGAMQLAREVNWTNEDITAAGHKFGKWPGWTYRKGNTALGIESGEKVAGVAVEVSRGSKKKLGPMFMIPGKVDKDGTGLVFRRNAAGKVQGVYGPAVYQLFRKTAEAIYEETADRLEKSIVDMAEREFAKNL